MDDLLILDSNKNKLKKVWKIINSKISNIELIVNNKSNIYRCSKGFNFLGYIYKYNNYKLKINYNKKTFYRIKKNLNYLKNNNLIKYNRSNASYYGYFNVVKKGKENKFKMNIEETYKTYKVNNKNLLLIIKDNNFYKAFHDDGKIIWYIFNYKYLKNNCSFGNIPYDKVIDKIKLLDIPFKVVSKNEEIISFSGDITIYESYLYLSNKAYDKYICMESLITKIKDLCKDYNNYENIKKYIEQLNND